MNNKTLMILAASGSAALLAGAFAFQHIGGMAPCKLCLWQRWPHGVAALIGALILVLGPRIWLATIGLISALSTAGVGLHHIGVEQKWWQGPQGCTGFDISDLSPTELMDAINAAPLVRCDEIAWSMLNLSMAGWNMVLATALTILWLFALQIKTT